MSNTKMTKDEKFAIWWCFNYAMKYVDRHSPNMNPYEHRTGPLDLIVDGVNINQTIKNLIGQERSTEI